MPKKTAIKKQVDQALPPPKPTSQVFMRGREFGMRFCQDFSNDELAEAISAMREGIMDHIRESQNRLDAMSGHLIRAEEAINP